MSQNNDHAALTSAISALIKAYANKTQLIGSPYDDLVEALHAFQNGEYPRRDLIETTDHLLSCIDDLAVADAPEFDAAQIAIQPYLTQP